MADAAIKTDSKNGGKAAKGKGGNKLRNFTIIIVVVFASPFIMPTLALMFLGMLPTLIAMVADTDRQKSSAIAIGSLNVAGICPFLIDLWVKGQHWDAFVQIVHQPATWLVMYGAAGVGKLIVFAVPPVLASFATIRYEMRLKILRDNMDTLKTTWGADVATTKPVSKLGLPE